MSRKVFIMYLCMLLCCLTANAQQKSELQTRAEAEAAAGKNAAARALWIRAYEDYAAKGRTADGVACGVKAAALYYGESLYQEAFDLLRLVDQSISADKNKSAAAEAAWRYEVVKAKLDMYVRMRRADRAAEQIAAMERLAAASADEGVKNDLLYNKAAFYYTFGQDAKGNAIFEEMARKLTANGEYDKVDHVYQTLIANGRRSGSAAMVAQAYSRYTAWKDSVSALKAAAEAKACEQKIAAAEAAVAERDETLAARRRTITGLGVLAAVLAAAGGLLLVAVSWLLALTRKHRKTIREARESNAQQARFISNISNLLSPTLQKLETSIPPSPGVGPGVGPGDLVKSLQNFATHIQTLSHVEATMGEAVEMEDTPLQPFCHELADAIRPKVRAGVTVHTDVPAMSARINKEYVAYILGHLLDNAVHFTPEGGHIRLDFKKRSAHKHQFLVSNTGEAIPEEQRDELFKPFREVTDLSKGDGLGLPICKRMAAKMNGDITIDPEFTKGTRFVLTLET